MGAAMKPRGAKQLLHATFKDFARSTLDDPQIQALIRKRLIDELEGKIHTPMPALAVLTSAVKDELPILEAPRAVVFVAEITNGRGAVTRMELGTELGAELGTGAVLEAPQLLGGSDAE